MAVIVRRALGLIPRELAVRPRPGDRRDCRRCARRYLLSDNVIRLLDFQQKKVALANQMYISKDQYFKTIEEKLKKNELILKDDLKMLLHLCQMPADVEVAKDVIYRYHAENKNMAFGEFRFGPLFVRLCYELGLEETAEEMVKDQNLNGFFNDSTSFNILMDMLFMKESYERALGVLMEMKNQGIKFNKDTYILAFAICYKLNTVESYRICTVLLEESLTRGNFIPRHAYYFAVALAIGQHDVENARSIYSQIMHTDSNICHNLHVFLLALSGEQQNLISALEAAIGSTVSKFVKKVSFAHEVMAVVRESMENNSELQGECEDICEMLQKSGQITALSLDEMLCHTPAGRKPLNPLLDQRKISRRTLQPLRSTLLSE
ncbi:pentatricopeptide repeat-containing protein 2, mitochondrial isoform X2 [Leucoraja erinacea]|uniref:pentatricopeptide repeat-containing protein 2, mitochondrial isoform X2 n=1 Tax=Leucoraja erinaceus TaxID=7782 RepID=UPI0024553A77|nr:pentatricopeptide repeat-containing protein 2, mitochondrial isoform X2 [Leucoraja erinacea]